jgi:hypothetical protein
MADITDPKDPIWRALRHPFPIIVAIVFAGLAIFHLIHNRNPIPALFFGVIEVIWASAIIVTFQTGEIQTTQGRGKKRTSNPIAYWWNVTVLLTFTLTFGVLFLLFY